MKNLKNVVTLSVTIIFHNIKIIIYKKKIKSNLELNKKLNKFFGV